MPNATAESKSAASATSSQISWLALALTPGLGPTRAKRLVEFFGSVEAVFNASLTELEAAGLPAAAAQSLGTGRSVELAHDEIRRPLRRKSNGSRSMMPPILRAFARSTTRRLSSIFVAMSQHSRSPALR